LISLIVPHMPFEESDKALKECLDSIIGVDEKLVIVNDGIGYGKAVNIGCKLSRGDYLIISNNDCTLINGTLRSLPDERGVSVPLIDPEPRDYNPRCFFCVPRWAYERLIEEDNFFFDERFEVGYFEDDDLIKRLNEYGIPIFIKEKVEIYHKDGGGLTMKKVGEKEAFESNKKAFQEKWESYC